MYVFKGFMDKGFAFVWSISSSWKLGDGAVLGCWKIESFDDVYHSLITSDRTWTNSLCCKRKKEPDRCKRPMDGLSSPKLEQLPVFPSVHSVMKDLSGK
ncbi:hypothetical protein GQ457_11G000540 [Hibiscus cannabinus]